MSYSNPKGTNYNKKMQLMAANIANYQNAMTSSIEVFTKRKKEQQAEADKKHVTGLLYFDNSKPSLAEDMELVDTPLVDVPDAVLRPSKDTLDKINAVLHS